MPAPRVVTATPRPAPRANPSRPPAARPLADNRSLPPPKVIAVSPGRRTTLPSTSAPVVPARAGPPVRAAARTAAMPPLGPIEDLASLGSPDGEPLVRSVATTSPTAPAGPLATESAKDAIAVPPEQKSQWADHRLAFAVEEALAGRYEEALAAVREVTRTLRGEPLAEDALRGEDAIRRRIELGLLSPAGTVFSVVKHNAADDMRGTRWARLFS